MLISVFIAAFIAAISVALFWMAVPRTVKATTGARCAWLSAHDYGGLRVNGKDDPLGLDPEGNGVACG